MQSPARDRPPGHAIRVHRRVLPNGVTLVAVERPGPTALLGVDVRVGARYEAPTDAGLSHFLEHMVFQGCEGYPTPLAVNDAAERMGAALDASTARDHTRFEHHVAADRVPHSAHLLAALLRAPAFEDIESERAIILEEALDEVDDTGRLVDPDTLSRRALWPDSPLGQSVIGDRARVQAFAVDDLRRHHRHHYVGANLVVSAVGPAPGEALLDTLAGAFAAHPPGPRVEPPSAGRLPGRPVAEVVADGRSQCECRLVFRTPGTADPLAPALQMLRLALDDGLASRMHRRLGAELGLAYDQWSAWERYVDSGAFEVAAVVSPGKVATFVDEAHGLLQGLITDPPRGDELERLRFRARWALECLLDAPEGLAALYATPHLYEAAPPTAAERWAQLAALGPDDLAAAAAAVFVPEGHVGCCVGPTGKAERRHFRARTLRFGG
jgi:predicted Zn-dependent peptidase